MIEKESIMREVFIYQNERTGLVPTYMAQPKYKGSDFKNLHRISSIGRIVDILEHFPDDEDIIERCERWAEGVWKYHRSKYGGLHDYVDVNTGEPSARGPTRPTGLERPFGLETFIEGEEKGAFIDWTYTSYYGSASLAFAFLFKVTGKEKYKVWCDALIDFVWDRRRRPTNIPPHTLTITGEYGDPIDTDCLYWVNKIFRIYRLLGEGVYRDIALTATDAWIKYGWVEEWEHFVVCVHGDGSPGEGDVFERIYGDGKYNTLEAMVRAYDATGDGRYMDYFDRFWGCLERNSVGGLFPQVLCRGKRVTSGRGFNRKYADERGVDLGQSIFLNLVIDAYDVTGDERYLRKAILFNENLRLKDERFKRGYEAAATRLETVARQRLYLIQRGFKGFSVDFMRMLRLAVNGRF